MTIDRIRSHYGLSRTPFGRDLAPSQIFAARTHKEAVARLRWLVDETAIGVVTGEVGAGKTLAARAAVATLDASRFTVVYLSNPMVGARGIHHHLVTALGETPKFHRPALIAQTADLLATETEERRKTVVLIVDEAHLLSVEQLEQLRLLTNTDMDSRSSLGLILLGQPTLRRRLKQGHFAALDQRIGLRFHLDGLPLDETAAYIAHHLALAGRGDTLFSDDATGLIHQTSRGIPRAINNLATQALVAAYADNKSIVDESAARAAITEVTAD
ncbi:MAG: ExeA family protein [Nitriliruptoraceae bacterium]